MILGCHVNFSSEQILGCAKQALMYGANTFMFYTGAPQNTMRKELDEEMIAKANEYMKEHDIFKEHVICHAPYIINLANKKDEKKWQFSIQFLKKEILRCEKMGVTKIVLHPGSAVGITKEEGIKNIIDGLNLVTYDQQTCRILLETMAGKGTECGCTLLEIKTILDFVEYPHLFGVCIDTCHLNDAGYSMQDFDRFLNEFDQVIGLSSLMCVHLNDSKNVLGSHKDRHENIGFGTMGFEVMNFICHHEALKNVPKILETPYVGESKEDKNRIYPPYRFEIEMLKRQTFDSHLYENIVNYYKKDL